MKYLFPHLLILFLFVSCTAKNYSKDECEQLSMDTFRGLPKQAAAFEKGCRQYKDLHYTKERCKAAFKDLILNGNPAVLKKNHGALILGCFNSREKSKFLKDEKILEDKSK